MADKKYRITRGNYTIKRTHKSLPDGTIYERDYMATTNLGGFEGNVFPNEEHGFKIVHRNNASVSRKHTYGKEESPVTLRTLEDEPQESSESRLVLSGKHSSLSDFVYYGNCVEFLQSSVENIILNFPGELYFTGKKAFEENGSTWYYIENPFEINIWDIVTPKETDVNEFRYFSLKGPNYILYDSKDDNKGCLGNNWAWNVTVNDDFIRCNGNYSHTIIIEVFDNQSRIEIRRYYLNGKYVLVHRGIGFIGSYIRLDQKSIDESFEKLKEFEKTLMNRGTNPLYTATLDFLYETDYGIKTYRKPFTWPLSAYDSYVILGTGIPPATGTFKGETWIVENESGTTAQTWNGEDWESDSKRNKYSHLYNIDISGERYEAYINSLIKLCTVYDENFTDNLWRNLTHDAIKNLDNTFIHENSDVDAQEIKENVEKVHKFLNACASQFDEIKRYADGIRNVNKITYDGDTNLPDYFLTDVLNLSGWEISNAFESLDTAGIEVSKLFDGELNHNYNSNEANILFLKNLKLNSREILSRKGTKYGIEMVLGLFGLKSKDFVTSYDGDNDWDFSIDEYVSIATPKEELATSATSLAVEEFSGMRKAYSESVGEGNDFGATDGLPVKIIEFEREGIKYRCMVPWFKAKSANNMPYNYDGDIYFQLYGGWEGTEVELSANETATTYNETMNYLGVVEKKGDLVYVPVSELHGDDIFYIAMDDCYYELVDINYCHEISDEKGWKKVTNEDTETLEKIKQMEAIVDTETGNNPHTGFGHYDSGAEFYEYLKQIFKYSIENDGFIDNVYICDCNDSGETCLESGITNCGFEIKQVKDNVKCWYFASEVGYPNNAENGVVDGSFDGLYEYDYWEEDNSSLPNFPYNFKYGESGTSVFTEYCADSIVNDKNMIITFKIPQALVESENEYMNYILMAVMPYVRQMIPATTIYKIVFEKEE